VKRFIERFELWRQERAAEREDNFIGSFLFLAAIILAQDAYTLFRTHHLTWRGALGSVATLAFVVLYIRQARWTWLSLMLLGLMFLVDAPLAYFSASPHLATGTRLIVAGIALTFAVGSFVYSLIVRKRFADATRTI
jgi:uncharacterized membrane protein YesL